MKCNACQQIEATVIFTKVAGDEKETLHLCPTCAAKEADQQTREGPPKPPEAAGDQHASPPQPAAGIVGGTVKKVNVVVGHLSPTGAKGGTQCPQCGTSYEEFRAQGRFGCAACYEAFASHLVRLFKRIHGAQTHTGKGPAQQVQPQDDGEELSQLKEKLREAVAEEAYERAAALRDRISSTQAEEGE